MPSSPPRGRYAAPPGSSAKRRRTCAWRAPPRARRAPPARGGGASTPAAGPLVVAREASLSHDAFQLPGPPLARLDTTLPPPLVLEALATALDIRLGGRTSAQAAGFSG